MRHAVAYGMMYTYFRHVNNCFSVDGNSNIILFQ